MRTKYSVILVKLLIFRVIMKHIYIIKVAPYYTVQLNIGQSLRDESDFTFRFLVLNNSLRGMKTSFVFVSQEIKKQKLL